MAAPCCPKCSQTHFSRSKDLSLRAWLVYCSHCGAVIGTMPTGFKTSKTSKDGWINPGGGSTTGSSSGGKTTTDDWETA